MWNKVKPIIVCIGTAALIADLFIRVSQYHDSRALTAPVDAIAHDELEKTLHDVADRAYRAGYLDGQQNK
jgi:hypothetical protein